MMFNCGNEDTHGVSKYSVLIVSFHCYIMMNVCECGYLPSSVPAFIDAACFIVQNCFSFFFPSNSDEVPAIA